MWVGLDGESEVIVERSDPRLPPDGIGVHGIRLSPDGGAMSPDGRRAAYTSEESGQPA